MKKEVRLYLKGALYFAFGFASLIVSVEVYKFFLGTQTHPWPLGEWLATGFNLFIYVFAVIVLRGNFREWYPFLGITGFITGIGYLSNPDLSPVFINTLLAALFVTISEGINAEECTV